MHFRLSAILIALLLLSLSPTVRAQGSEAPAMECSAGPLVRMFGGTPWNVYSCADGVSVVVVTTEENPAAPFYFFVFKRDETYVVYGEGTGAKSITDLAYNELIKLGASEVASLISAAKRIPAAANK